MIDWLSIDGLDWGVGISAKNETHLVSLDESEQTFFNKPLLLLSDTKHSQHEPRYHALGKIHDGRRLHISFTLRKANYKIRVISARDMQKRSVLFMKHLKEIPAFATETEEKAFWLTHDSAESLD